MSFNFAAFMAALNKMLPVIGETVIALHPENVPEAIKIRTGTALISGVTDALVQAASTPASPAADQTPSP